MASLFVLLKMEIGSLRRQRIFRDRLNPLDAYSDEKIQIIDGWFLAIVVIRCAQI